MKKTVIPIFLLLILSMAVYAQKQSVPDFPKQPGVKWTFKTGGPIFSSPVISDGLAIAGCLDSVLYAVNVETGALQWKLKTSGEIRSTVLVKNGRVYLLGGNGLLSCIETHSGKVLWRKLFDNTALFLGERRYDFADYFHSSPVEKDGLIYFGNGSTRFYAVNAENGEEAWSFKAGDIIHNTALLDDHRVYFGSYDGYVYALDAHSGTLIWKFKSTGFRYFPIGEMQGSPALALGNLFIGSRDFNFYALNVSGGYANWTKKIEHGWGLSATVRDSAVFIGTSDDHLLIKADAIYGNNLWATDLKFNIFGNCCFSDHMVYAGTIWGKLYGVDAASGKIVWAFATKSHSLNHDRYFKADDSYRDDIGEILTSPPVWIQAEYSMGGIFSTPAISGNMMIVTSAEGTIYGLTR